MASATVAPPRATWTVAACGDGLATTTRKSKVVDDSSAVLASGTGQYSQPTFDAERSASAHRSAQKPSLLQPTFQSAQSRPTPRPVPSALHTIDTVPSHCREPGTQVTHPSSGSHACGQVTGSRWVRPSAAHS